MIKLLRVAVGTAFLGTFALGACGSGLTPASNPAAPLAPAAFVPSATEWIYKDGILFHRPHYAAPYSPGAVRPQGFVFVPYRGGPVILDPKFYLTFWGYNVKRGDPDKVQRLLEKYIGVMGGSGHNNIEIQYYQDSTSHEYITNPAKQYGGSWNDDSAVPKSPSDTQVAAEAVNAVHHFGYDPNGVYFVATPHNHSEVGFPTHWCAYHSFTFDRKKPVPYAYFPYVPDGGTSCGQNIITPPSDESGTDEGVTIMGGHEAGEAITDPQPFSAWTGPSGEIADECAWHNIANDTFGRKSYTMQPMASDATEACVQTYTPSP